jgi:hypothetical protein
MIKVLFPAYTYGFAEKVQDYYRVLQRGHFMEMLLTIVTLADGKQQPTIKNTLLCYNAFLKTHWI